MTSLFPAPVQTSYALRHTPADGYENRPIVFFDTETELISPGRNAPPMCCLSYVVRARPGADPKDDLVGLIHWTQAGEFLRVFLEAGATLVGANVAFDVLVSIAQFPLLLPLWREAYRENRVQDVQTRQKLLDTAAGCYRGYLNSKLVWVPLKYSLADLTRRHTDIRLDKDTRRLRYGELRPYPVESWPEGAREYARMDAVATQEVWDNQNLANSGPIDALEDQFRQVRGDLFLKSGATWGLRTEEEGVKELERQTVAHHDALEEKLIAAGLVKVKKIGGKNPRVEKTRNTKAAKALMLQVCGWQEVPAGTGHNGTDYSPIDPNNHRPLVLTEGGDVALGQEPCDDSESPLLKDYGDYGAAKTVLSKDVKALLGGIMYPIHTRYDFAASGRVTSSGPNIQNWRTLPGIREAFHPRPGYVYLQSDVGGLELATFAQFCYTSLGYSVLRDALIAGLDPHLDLAALILANRYPHEGWTYEKAYGIYVLTGKSHPDYERVYNARQTAKVANFGFPGGLGAASMVEYAKALYGVILTLQEAMELKEHWQTKWPEARDFFKYINAHMTNPDGTGQIRQLFSNRIRGATPYCAACNTTFQGLGADVMKHVGFELWDACYTRPESPIFGGRPVVFAHDENIVEYPDCPGMHEAALELARITETAGRVFLPDVPIKAPPAIMRYWSKKAEAVYDGNKRLVPWDGRKKAA